PTAPTPTLRSLHDALPICSENAVAGTARKAWRFVGEMEELTASFAAAGVPAQFHEAGAEVYRRLADYKDTPAAPSVDEVSKTLADRKSTRLNSSHQIISYA